MVVLLHYIFFLSLFSVVSQTIRYELLLKCKSLLAAVDNQTSDKHCGTSHFYPLSLSSDLHMLKIQNSAASKGPVRCCQSVASVASLSL